MFLLATTWYVELCLILTFLLKLYLILPDKPVILIYRSLSVNNNEVLPLDVIFI